jgi:hypothetical protein
MKYLLCPKQYQAQQGIMRGFSDNVFTILGGEARTGKTTVALRLLKHADSARVYTAYVPGRFTKAYGNVYSAFAAALGLPLSSHFMAFRNVEYALEDLIGGREFRLVFDDARVHFGGGAEQRNNSIDLVGALLRRFQNLKILAVSGPNILDGDLKKVVAKEARYVDIGLWQDDQQFRIFITRVGVACGFKRSQLLNDDFIKGLLDRSHGASGALIQILQTLARNPSYNDCASLPVECLRNMWDF